MFSDSKQVSFRANVRTLNECNPARGLNLERTQPQWGEIISEAISKILRLCAFHIQPPSRIAFIQRTYVCSKWDLFWIEELVSEMDPSITHYCTYFGHLVLLDSRDSLNQACCQKSREVQMQIQKGIDSFVIATAGRGRTFTSRVACFHFCTVPLTQK